jgi:hypothetical protein
LDLLQHRGNRGLVEKISLEQLDSIPQMLNALEVFAAATANHATDTIALAKEEFGEVAAVLAGDTGNESGPGHP